MFNGKYKLGIVSDAWPSLIRIYKANKLFDMFDGFVISSYLGVGKPDKLMYETALNELEIKMYKL